jgi:hypothetical protein
MQQVWRPTLCRPKRLFASVGGIDRNLSAAGPLKRSAQQGCDPLTPDGREDHVMPARWAEDRRLSDASISSPAMAPPEIPGPFLFLNLVSLWSSEQLPLPPASPALDVVQREGMDGG